MLSRHFLRAKALQTIYAGIADKTVKTDDLLEAFDYNVSRLVDLSNLQLSTLGQLFFCAERILEAEKTKFKPQKTDIDALTKLISNSFVDRLCSSFLYRRMLDHEKIDWSNNVDIFRKVLSNFRSSKQFAEYLTIDEPSFDDDRNIAIVAFKYLMNDDALREVIFDRDLLWEDDFDQIAQYLYMTLKALSDEDTNEAMPCPTVFNRNDERELNAYNFARQLVADTYNHLDDVEPLIRKHLQNWEMERVATIDVILINMAVAEFTCCPSIPERVTVDEYIELSKEFSTEKSKLFINGILDKILIELRVAGRVVKNERGLYDPDIDGGTPPDEF
jgi:N utilization substance protein B